MIAQKPLTDAEKALVSGGTNGENNIIPQDVRTEIMELRKQYKSAKVLTNILPTETLSGSFTFESGTPSGLADFVDGSAVAEETGVTFVNKPFTIKHKGKLIPISNILKRVEKGGLLSYLNRWFVKNAIISENKAIFDALKKDKTAKVIKGIEGLKSSINLDLDPSARIGGLIITNQTGFNILDSEKDVTGRPVLASNPANNAEKLLAGLQIEVFSDAELPNISAGKAPVFYGSILAGCQFMDFMQMELSISEHYLFGKNQTAMLVTEGFDVIQADADAYVYATLTAADPVIVKTETVTPPAK